MDFDADRIYYSHQNLHQQQDGDGRAEQQQGASRLEDEEERAVDSDALRRHFREFLRKFAHDMCIDEECTINRDVD
jgi:hypothetical protein